MAVLPHRLEQNMSTYQFNPNEHIIQIKSQQGPKDYLPAQWRVVWFRSVYPEGSVETEMLHLDLDRDTEEETSVWNAEQRRNEKIIKQAKGFVVFKAVVKDGKGGIGTGTKSEKAASFPDFIEKAETGAIGRALAALGYGTQFTGDEWDEAHRIVDSPVDQAAQQEEVASVRKDWAATYNVADAQIDERWPGFIVWVLGKAIAEQDLKPYQIKKLRDRIEEQKRVKNKGVDASPAPPATQAPTKIPAPTAQKLDGTTKKRLDAIYDRALALGEFQKGATKEESGTAFFALLTKIINAKVTAPQQLTTSRLDTIEQYLAGKEIASKTEQAS